MPDSPWLRRVMRQADRYAEERREQGYASGRRLPKMYVDTTLTAMAARRRLRALLREKEAR